VNKIIVTGGAGFIGSAVVKELNNQGIKDIIIVDHLGNSEKWKNLRNLIYSDYYEKSDFFEVLAHNVIKPDTIDTIIHLGACSSTTENDSSYLVKNNFEFSKTLASYAVSNNIRFIYASSAATYGMGELGYSDNHDLIEKLQPLNMYGYSKQMFDLWVKQNNLLDKFAGLKFFNIFGPNEFHKNDMRSMVVKAYEQIKSTGRVKLFKSDNPDYEHGKQMRDFFYVKHTAELVYEFVKNRELNGIFNIGSGKASTWIELVSPIFEALNLPVNIDFVDMPDNLKNKYQYFTEADMNKLYSVIPAVEFNLSSAVKDYVLNYLEKDCYL